MWHKALANTDGLLAETSPGHRESPDGIPIS